MRRLLASLIPLVSVSACQAGANSAADSTTHPADTNVTVGRPNPSTDSIHVALRLVDSIPYHTETNEGVLRHVEIRQGQRLDTLKGVLTRLPAAASGDSLVFGFFFDSFGELTHAFRFSLAGQQLDSLPLPNDLKPGVSEPALAPDAKHLAYVAFDSMARGVVRRWPDLATILETPRLSYSAGDMLAGAAEWRDSKVFTIYIDPFHDGSNRWVRFQGRIGSAQLAVDTIYLGDQP